MPENEELAPNEIQEVKEQRRKDIQALTEQFLASGGKVNVIPTGKSSKKLRAVKPTRSGGSPIVLVNDEEKKHYRQGEHPRSSNAWIFADKK